MKRTAYEAIYECGMIQVYRCTIGRLGTGQSYYGYRVHLLGRKPRYFSSEDAYNGTKAEAYFLAHAPAIYRQEGILFANWSDGKCGCEACAAA